MFGYFTRIAPHSRLICIAEAIPHASPDEIESGFLRLISAASVAPRARGSKLHRLACKLLIQCWAHAPASLRPAILDLVAAEPAFVDAAMDEIEPSRLCASLALAGELGRIGRAERVVELLSHSEPGVSRAANETLHALVTRGETAASSRLVALAAGAFPEHRSRPVLMLAIQRLDLASRRERHGVRTELSAWAGDGARPELSTARSVLKSAPGLARRAMELLTAEPFAAAALERSARAIEGEEAPAIASAWHLGLRASRARRLALVSRRAKSATPAPLARAMRPSLDVESRVGAARLMPMLGHDDSTRDRLLEPMLADPSPRVRRALLEVGGHASRRDLCFDPDASIAASAALAWSTIGVPDQLRVPGASGGVRARLARSLTRSPHASVRAIATDALERSGLESAGSPASAIVARRLLAEDPDRFDTTILGLLSTGGDEALRALGFVRRLGLARRFEAAIAALARVPDARLAATAAAALAMGRSPHTLGVLRGSCEHDDSRVRANAIEALSRRGATDRDAEAMLIELKPDPHHRARAAALRHRLARAEHAEPHVADELLEMLAHPSPDHRRASMWVLDRHVRAHGWGVLRARREKLLARLTEAIRGDQAEPVRAWAIRCARGVLASTRLDWSRSAPDVHAGAAA